MKTQHVFLGLLVSILVFNACGPKVEACFGYEFTGNTASFNAQCSEAAKNYKWDFGDGSTSTDQNPNHTFTESGTYDVELIVHSKTGFRDKLVETIEVDVCEMTCVGGDCINGNCECQNGYFGNNCEQTLADKFIGNYTNSEFCLNGNGQSLRVIIEKGIGPFALKIFGLFDSNSIYVSAFVANDGNSFTANRQSYLGNREIEITSAAINSNTGILEIAYTVYIINSSNIIDQCNANLRR